VARQKRRGKKNGSLLRSDRHRGCRRHFHIDLNAFDVARESTFVLIFVGYRRIGIAANIVGFIVPAMMRAARRILPGTTSTSFAEIVNKPFSKAKRSLLVPAAKIYRRRHDVTLFNVLPRCATSDFAVLQRCQKIEKC
jgi:hypothetical protein